MGRALFLVALACICVAPRILIIAGYAYLFIHYLALSILIVVFNLHYALLGSLVVIIIAGYAYLFIHYLALSILIVVFAQKWGNMIEEAAGSFALWTSCRHAFFSSTCYY